MTSRDFAYWLQGFFELSKESKLTSEQVEIIKNHLNMVFYHDIDKGFGEDLGVLKEIHTGESGRTYDYRGVIKPSDSTGRNIGGIRVNC